MSRYAIARFPTPVLKTPDFSHCFGGKAKDCLPLDEQQLLRPVEMILFPNSKLKLLEKIDTCIWRICTEEHPCTEPLYVDERFIAFVDAECPERTYALPSIEHMVEHLKTLLGIRYIWGGNWPQGVPQLMEWYKPVNEASLSGLIHDTWQLKGVDCSGLLYYVCQGCCPRNTSELVEWGKAVPIAGKNIKTISATLLPLDLIAWRGHVVIVLDSHTVIESRGGFGVVICSLEERLQEILNERKAVDSYVSTMPSFVIRRCFERDLTM